MLWYTSGMILPSSLRIPPCVLAGEGSLAKLPPLAMEKGRRGVFVHGGALAGGEARSSLDAAFRAAGLDVVPCRHRGGEPTLEEVEALRSILRETRADWVLGAGGGSVLDLAKAAAGLAGAPAAAADYQAGAAIPPSRLPFLAAPTTAGTGSEATEVAVLTNPAKSLKQSIRHPSFLPCTVALDPALLRDCPAPVLAASGMDALTQAFESLTSNKATPFTRALSELSLVRLAKALPAAYRGDRSADVLADLLEGSFLAGVALSHARLGVVHGLAHPLGVRWGIPHGQACAICLPAALAFNAPVIAGDLARIEELLGTPFPRLVEDFLREFHIESPLRGKAPDEDVLAAIVRETLASGSTAANPRPVDAAAVRALLDVLFAADPDARPPRVRP
jgi:alcohol dehydrogenase class IV